MKHLHLLLLPILTFFTTQATAHVGPEAIDRHLIEHLLIAFAIGLPIGYGFFRLMKRSGDSSR